MICFIHQQNPLMLTLKLLRTQPMTNTPIDEYIFWKNLIEEKQEAGESVPGMMHELLEHAEKKAFHYLMNKYSINDLSDEINCSLH